MDAAVPPSPALLAANRRLYELRAQAQVERLAAGGCRPRGQQLVPGLAEPALRNAGFRVSIADLPDHLGWESQVFTVVMRRAQSHQRVAAAGSEKKGAAYGQEDARLTPELSSAVSASTPSQQASPRPEPDSVRLHPSLALGMLRQEQAAAGRLWLLLRYLDGDGRGRLGIEEARARLTGRGSDVRLCGRRQLRNLLRQGQGIFWHRDSKNIWLRSVANVAAALGVERLDGRPVRLPLNLLLGSIGDVRAHLYASFHSGRVAGNKRDREAKPIARATLASISGVARRTQRSYEERAGVLTEANFAVGARATAEGRQEAAGQHGQATFVLKDHRGRQGPAGTEYLAWQLPNSYAGAHEQCARGRQRRINRKLADLRIKGAGNGRKMVEKRYHGNGTSAAKAYHRAPDRDLYWRDAGQRRGMWYVLPGRAG
jgi:hypothetical protein